MYSRPSLSPQFVPLPDFSVKDTIVLSSSKYGIVESPLSVHSQSRWFLQPLYGSLCATEGGLGLDKQGPDVERRGQITGGEGCEKRAGSGTLLHSLTSHVS